VIGPGAGTRIWIVAGLTDLRRGFTGLAAVVQTALEENPFSGQVFVFRGRRGDLIEVLWWDGDGLCLFAKRLDRGRFIRPPAAREPPRLSHLATAINASRSLSRSLRPRCLKFDASQSDLCPPPFDLVRRGPPQVAHCPEVAAATRRAAGGEGPQRTRTSNRGPRPPVAAPQVAP
jgi:transposase